MVRWLGLFLILLCVAGCSSMGDEWYKTTQVNTVEAYQQFLDLHPEEQPYADFARCALDSIAYLKVISKALSASDLNNFLEEATCPRYLEIARREQDNLDWRLIDESKKKSSFEWYLKEHPQGRWTGEAREKLAELEQAEAERAAEETRIYDKFLNSPSSMTALLYLSDYPDGDYAKEVADVACSRNMGIAFHGQCVILECLRATAADSLVVSTNQIRNSQLVTRTVKPSPGNVFVTVESLLYNTGTPFTLDQSDIELVDSRGARHPVSDVSVNPYGVFIPGVASRTVGSNTHVDRLAGVTIRAEIPAASRAGVQVWIGGNQVCEFRMDPND